MKKSIIISILAIFAQALISCSESPVEVQEDTGYIKGKVYFLTIKNNTMSMEGIRNVEVKVVGTDLTAKTNSSGEYTITGVPVGMQEVKVTTTYPVRAYETRSVLVGKQYTEWTTLLTFSPHEGKCIISGVVFEADKTTKAKNISVILEGSPKSIITDSEGHYGFVCQPGTYKLKTIINGEIKLLKSKLLDEDTFELKAGHFKGIPVYIP